MSGRAAGATGWLPTLAPFVFSSPRWRAGLREQAGSLEEGAECDSSVRTLFEVGERVYEGVREAMCEMLRWLREGGELEAPWGTPRAAMCSCEQPWGRGETGAAVCERDCSRSSKYARKIIGMWPVNGGKQVGICTYGLGFRWAVT